MNISRRTFVKGLGGLGIAAGTGFGYLRWGEPGWFETTETRIETGRSDPSRPTRILHLSDLHASDVVPLEMIARAVAMGVALNPDVVVLTGDFWTDRYWRISEYAAVLRPLAECAPAFAVAGNHDGGGWAQTADGWTTLDPFRELLKGAGIRLLFNEAVELATGGRTLTLLGVGDWWSADCMPHRTFARAAPRRPDLVRIVLNHNPDALNEFADYDWDLMCCGHTHGGQLRVPFTGQTPFAPVRDHRYVAGLNPWRGRRVFTTRGVGNLHGVRFNCRPEISLLLVS